MTHRVRDARNDWAARCEARGNPAPDILHPLRCDQDVLRPLRSQRRLGVRPGHVYHRQPHLCRYPDLRLQLPGLVCRHHHHDDLTCSDGRYSPWHRDSPLNKHKTNLATLSLFPLKTAGNGRYRLQDRNPCPYGVSIPQGDDLRHRREGP